MTTKKQKVIEEQVKKNKSEKGGGLVLAGFGVLLFFISPLIGIIFFIWGCGSYGKAKKRIDDLEVEAVR